MKNRNTAKEKGLEVRDFIAQNLQLFKSLYENLEVSYDIFLSTSDEQMHYHGAKLMRERLVAAGDIYKKSYEGLYCE